MKKSLTLLLIIPLFSICQNQGTYVSSFSVDENELVLSEKSVDIRTPLTTDLNKYTHLLLVNIITIGYGSELGYWNQMYGTQRGTYEDLKNRLSFSIFDIMTPREVNKKKARKDPTFLKTIKKENYLYVYYSETRGRGDDLNTTLIIRDWENNIIYNAKYVNAGIDEVLAPLIEY